MKLNITAELTGNEISAQLLDEIKTKHGIVVNEGGYTVKCIVLNKDNKPVEIPLEKVTFVFQRQ